MLTRAAFRSTTLNDTLDNIVPRNAFYGDGVKVVDMALAKIFRLPWQGHSIAVRLEGYNVFNWVQFGFPVNDITSPTFGRINGTATQYAPRTVQVVLRYRY